MVEDGREAGGRGDWGMLPACMEVLPPGRGACCPALAAGCQAAQRLPALLQLPRSAPAAPHVAACAAAFAATPPAACAAILPAARLLAVPPASPIQLSKALAALVVLPFRWATLAAVNKCIHQLHCSPYRRAARPLQLLPRCLLPSFPGCSCLAPPRTQR